MDADPGCDIAAVARWLVEGAHSARQPAEVLAQLCERLTAGGIPLSRAAVFVRTLHPQVMGRRLSWQPHTGIGIGETGHETVDTETFRLSPVAHVYSTGARLRRR